MSPGPDEGASVQSKSKRKTRKGKERADPDNHAAAEQHPAGETVNAAQQLIPPWAWTILADSDASGCPPVFDRDAKYFFVASSSSVRIYSVATTRVVSTLRIQSYNERSGSTTPRITGLLISPQNPFQLITASSDGRVRIWDFLDAVLLRTIECRLHISHIVAHSSLKDYVIVAGTKKKGGRFRLYRVSISPSPPDSGPLAMKEAYENAKFGADPLLGLVISSSGSHIVAILGNNVYVVQTAQLSSPLAEYSSPNPLTCLAFHPVDEIFATGDTEGIIRIWYCLDSRKNMPKNTLDKRRSKAPTRVLHWHAHAVGGLAFSSNGAYLLSGGEEAVFVVWQLESRHKEFVPRLGAPIEHVTITPEGSSGEQGYLLSLADGGLSFIDAGSLKVTRTFVQLRRTSRTHETANESTGPAPLAIHPTTSHIILPSSHPSSLQIYAPRSSELISELEVSPSNRVSRRDETPLEQACVTHAVICASGEWMSTVDIRHGGVDFADEVMLKIWHWENGNWVLNTRIDRPHGADPVTSLAFSPRSLDDAEDYVLLTAGANGMLRTWRPWKTHDGDVYWASRSSFSYRSQFPSQAVWSPDASLIAVAHGPSTTVWEPISNTLIMSLSCAGADSVYDLAFLGSSGRHLATYTGKDIIVWDLIANSIAWTHPIHLSKRILVPHPAEDTFALIGNSPSGGRVNPSTHLSSETDTLVMIFGVSSSQPLHSYSLPFKLRHAIWYPTSDPVNESDTHSAYSLLAVTIEQKAVLVGDDVVVHSLETSASREITSAEETFERTTIFQDLFGKSAFANLEERGQPSKVEVQRSLPDISTGTKVLDLTILDGPSHLLPPIGSLFDSLIDSFTRSEDPRTPPSMQSESLKDKDVEMREVEEADDRTNVTSTRRRAPRQIDKEEMSLFTGLFRAVLSASPERTTISPSKQANGSTNGNGNVKGHYTGSRSNGKLPPMSFADAAHDDSPATKEKSLRTRKPKANNAPSTSTPRVKSTEPIIPSPSPSIGQKRKKSGT